MTSTIRILLERILTLNNIWSQKGILLEWIRIALNSVNTQIKKNTKKMNNQNDISVFLFLQRWTDTEYPLWVVLPSSNSFFLPFFVLQKFSFSNSACTEEKSYLRNICSCNVTIYHIFMKQKLKYFFLNRKKEYQKRNRIAVEMKSHRFASNYHCWTQRQTMLICLLSFYYFLFGIGKEIYFYTKKVLVTANGKFILKNWKLFLSIFFFHFYFSHSEEIYRMKTK